MRKKATYLLVVGICLFLFGTSSLAQEFKVQLQGTSSTPIFMTGHEGDLNWITGINYTTDIYWFESQTKIGTVSGSVMFIDPPLNLSSLFASVTMEETYTIDGYGTFRKVGEGTALFRSETLSSGVFFQCSHGKILDGTSYYQDWFGVSVQWGAGNLYFPTALVLTEIWYFQYGSP